MKIICVRQSKGIKNQNVLITHKIRRRGMGGCLTRRKSKKYGRKVNKQHLPRLSTFCNIGSNFIEERTKKNKKHKETGGQREYKGRGVSGGGFGVLALPGGR